MLTVIISTHVLIRQHPFGHMDFEYIVRYLKSIFLLKLERKEGTEKEEKRKKINALTLTLWKFSL